MADTVSSSDPDTSVATTQSPIPKEVLAFYYGWYGNPSTNGSLIHWDTEPGSTTQASNITDTPVDGLYSSQDPAEVARQMAEAQAAGLTGFIASWWGINDYTNQGMPLLLQQADASGMKITAMMDTRSITGTTAAQLMTSAEDDLEYLVRNYASNPAWLTVDGKPVIFIYGGATNQLTPDEWTTVLQVADASTPNGIIVLGPDSAALLPVFNGGFDYSHAGSLENLTLSQADTWTAKDDQSVVQQETAAGQIITTNTVVPGFNNTNAATSANPPVTPTVVSRDNGALYADEWQNAIATDPDWVLVSTWNEWHEGSEIEPSTQYGTSYLTQTATDAQQFLDDTAQAACFAQGTRIGAPSGAINVEALRVGDMVLSARRGIAVPVRWMGHRGVACARHPDPGKVSPVRVRAGAMGRRLPVRDLWLSPDHAVFVDGVLIPVHALLNGDTVSQPPVDTVTYWHVEVDEHDVLLAEGLPVESYLDIGGRAAFSGGVAMPPGPDVACRVWEAAGCALLRVTGPEVDAVRARLARRRRAVSDAKAQRSPAAPPSTSRHSAAIRAGSGPSSR